MVVDFHTHIFPDVIAGKTIKKLEEYAQIKACSDGTLNGLKKDMKEAGVNLSIILPVVTRPEQFASINAFAAKVNKEQQYDKNCMLHSFGGLHPNTETYKNELREIKALGLKGIKLHPDYQGVNFDDIKYMRIVEYASMLDLAIVVHAGVDIGLPDPVHCTPQMSRKVIDEVKPKKLVLAHMGGWKQWDEVEEQLVGQEVYLDTAFSCDYMEKEQFVRIVNQHGADHVVFATDSPWSSSKADVAKIKSYFEDQETQDKIFYKNALQLLGIKEQ